MSKVTAQQYNKAAMRWRRGLRTQHMPKQTMGHFLVTTLLGEDEVKSIHDICGEENPDKASRMFYERFVQSR